MQKKRYEPLPAMPCGAKPRRWNPMTPTRMILLATLAFLMLLAAPAADARQIARIQCGGTPIETAGVCPGYEASVMQGECTYGYYDNAGNYHEVAHSRGLAWRVGAC